MACVEARRLGAADPWAPYVRAALLLYIVTAVVCFGVSEIRRREWKAVVLIALWMVAMWWLLFA